MAELSPRVKLTPQMRDYDNLVMPWRPYVMYMHAPSYSSTSINTDPNGLRWSTDPQGRPVSLDTVESECGILVGGSTAFGVGATSDSATISAHLGSLTGYPWLNFGGRAFGPAQELMLFVTHVRKLRKIRKIVLFSGLNAIVIRLLSRCVGEDFPPFYFQSRFETSMERASLSPKRRLLAGLLRPLLGDSVDWSRDSGSAIAGKALSHLLSPSAHRSAPVADPGNAALIRLAIQDVGTYLQTWRMLANGLGCELVFALQPFADWLEREPSTEEKSLFAHLESLPGNTFSLLHEALGGQVHQDYAAAIQGLCAADGIPFIDTNPPLAQDKDWLFVDRVHLTDAGNEKIAGIIHGKGM